MEESGWSSRLLDSVRRDSVSVSGASDLSEKHAPRPSPSISGTSSGFLREDEGLRRDTLESQLSTMNLNNKQEKEEILDASTHPIKVPRLLLRCLAVPAMKPPQGLPRRNTWLTYGHSQNRLKDIKYTNSILVQKILAISSQSSPSSFDTRKHDALLDNAEKSRSARRKAESLSTTRENECISKRLKLVKPSKDIDRHGLYKDFIVNRSYLNRLRRQPLRPT